MAHHGANLRQVPVHNLTNSERVHLRQQNNSFVFWGECVRNIANSSLLASSFPSAWDHSAPTWRILMKFYIWEFFDDPSRNFEIHYNLKRTTGTLHEDRCRFFIISFSFLLRMKNISDKICRETQNTHFVFSDFFSKILPFSKIMWKNVEWGRPQDNMAHAHCILDT